ncbi:tRNA (adenosine(37)-N6)-threonylcarbamoyltransferase complex dimerization subunit type 1 TsaB [Candidatus Peregrinibacteria bacterium]|nr:tRNA (adenosine(37)-N6)-threonylcarbamoyltransferase complex dimerization subunit type 1 TsaB [Candidatus Peregrinibacteria bacterium]
MLTLGINTASSTTSIALFDCEKNKLKLLKEQSWLSKNDEADRLMPEIYKLLGKKHFRFPDIKKIIAVKGPGSFTGLRVGITVANTMAYLNKCDLFEINSFELWWKGFSRSGKKRDAALLIYSGIKGVYASLFASVTAKNEMIPIDDLDKFLKKHKIKIVFGDIHKDQKKIIKSAKFFNIKKTFGEIIEKFSLDEITKVTLINPMYIKSPQITPKQSEGLPANSVSELCERTPCVDNSQRLPIAKNKFFHN